MGCCSSTRTYTLEDGSIFEGSGKVDHGCLYEGKGIIYHVNGSTFEGIIQQGHKVGKGTYIQNEEFQYTGDWVNDTYHGKGDWSTTRPSEDTQIQRYSGDFRNGCMTGSAVISYSNGSVYRGKVIDGSRSGQGILENSHQVVYNGQWANNTYHGYGTRYYDNGEYYVGYFNQGKRSGRGTYGSVHTSNRMDAEWVDDIPQGIYSGELPATRIYMEGEGVYKTHNIRECVICMDREPSLVYLPCRHFCVCAHCTKQTLCPICRVEILDVIQPIY